MVKASTCHVEYCGFNSHCSRILFLKEKQKETFKTGSLDIFSHKSNEKKKKKDGGWESKRKKKSRA